MTQIAVRLPDDLVAAIDRMVPEHHSSRSELIRRAIELHLHRLAAEHDALQYEKLPLTDADLALADNPSGWDSTAPW